MRALLVALLLCACDDGSAPALCHGMEVPPGEVCCPAGPAGPPNYGLPTGSCATVGQYCVPSATDVLCQCMDSGWECRAAFQPHDLSFPVMD
jgi:hypothetical protein